MHHRTQKGSRAVRISRKSRIGATIALSPRSIRYLSVRTSVDLEQTFARNGENFWLGRKCPDLFDPEACLPAVLFALGADLERQSPSARPADLALPRGRHHRFQPLPNAFSPQRCRRLPGCCRDPVAAARNIEHVRKADPIREYAD